MSCSKSSVMLMPSRRGSRRTSSNTSRWVARNGCRRWSRRWKGTRRTSPSLAAPGIALSRPGPSPPRSPTRREAAAKTSGFFPVSMSAVMYKGKAYGIPQSVSPWPLVTMDILEAAKVDPRGPGRRSSKSASCKNRPGLRVFGMCLGLHTDADNYVIMNMIWNYGGKLIEADDRAVVPEFAGDGASRQGNRRYVPQAQDHPQRGDFLG